MSLPTRARIAVILAACLVLLGSTGALAGFGPSVDVLIGLGNPPDVGDGTINTTGAGQEVTGVGCPGDKQTFYILIQNQDYAPDAFKVKRSSGYSNGYRVRYFDANGT